MFMKGSATTSSGSPRRMRRRSDARIGIAEHRFGERPARYPSFARRPGVERGEQRRLGIERRRGREQRERRPRAPHFAQRRSSSGAGAELLETRGAAVRGDVEHGPRRLAGEHRLVMDPAELAARARRQPEAARGNERVIELDDAALETARRAVGVQLDRARGHPWLSMVFPFRPPRWLVEAQYPRRLSTGWRSVSPAREPSRFSRKSAIASAIHVAVRSAQ